MSVNIEPLAENFQQTIFGTPDKVCASINAYLQYLTQNSAEWDKLSTFRSSEGRFTDIIAERVQILKEMVSRYEEQRNFNLKKLFDTLLYYDRSVRSNVILGLAHPKNVMFLQNLWPHSLQEKVAISTCELVAYYDKYLSMVKYYSECCISKRLVLQNRDKLFKAFCEKLNIQLDCQSPQEYTEKQLLQDLYRLASIQISFELFQKILIFLPEKQLISIILNDQHRTHSLQSPFSLTLAMCVCSQCQKEFVMISNKGDIYTEREESCHMLTLIHEFAHIIGFLQLSMLYHGILCDFGHNPTMRSCSEADSILIENLVRYQMHIKGYFRFSHHVDKRLITAFLEGEAHPLVLLSKRVDSYFLFFAQQQGLKLRDLKNDDKMSVFKECAIHMKMDSLFELYTALKIVDLSAEQKEEILSTMFYPITKCLIIDTIVQPFPLKL